MSAAAAKPSIRDYDRDRMHRIALAMWGAVLVELKDEQGVVFMPSSEILDAMTLFGGILLSSWPDAKVPSKLRGRCEEHARALAERTRDAMRQEAGSSLFDVVMSEPAEAMN